MANFGVYRGVVMNTADPAMKGRLQVNVPGIAGLSAGWASACREYGAKTTPPIGTAVWVMFEAGDVSKPIWIGCAA